MQSLPRYRCERYEELAMTLSKDAESFDLKSKTSLDDRVAKASAGLVFRTKRTLARKLEEHIHRCGLCR